MLSHSHAVAYHKDSANGCVRKTRVSVAQAFSRRGWVWS